jgi:hypothetical protein
LSFAIFWQSGKKVEYGLVTVPYLNKSVELSDALESEFIHQVDLVSKTEQMHLSNEAKHQRQRVGLRRLLGTYIQKATTDIGLNIH